MTGKQPQGAGGICPCTSGGVSASPGGVGAVICAYQPQDPPAMPPPLPEGRGPLLPEGRHCRDRHPALSSDIGGVDDWGVIGVIAGEP